MSGLQRAYRLDAPFVERGVLYIPGTRRWTDWLDNAKIPLGLLSHSAPFLEADRAFYSAFPRPRMVVGHSLGAAVAAELHKKYGVLDVGYGSPVSNSINFADSRDPVHLLRGPWASFHEIYNDQPWIHHG